LAAGLLASAVAAFAVIAVLLGLHRIPHDLILADTKLRPSLTKLGPGSIAVAIAAGMAGILAFERVVGAAVALGKANPAEGAMVVLVTNVVLIVAASTATLAVQRHRIDREAGASKDGTPSPTRGQSPPE
jgi:uncharacterized membrane protein YidH (DUF202 family)